MKRFAVLKNILGWGVVGAVGVYFARTLSKNWDQVSGLDVAVNYQTILAIILFMLAVINSGQLWGGVFNRISGQSVNAREAIRSHLGAWLLKYIPGQAGSFVYKLRWGETIGSSKKVTAVAFAYEMLFLTLASTVLVIPILLITLGDRTGSSLFALYVAGLAVLLLLSRKFMNTLIGKFIQKVTGMQIARKYILDLKEVVGFTARFSFSRILNAVGFVVLAASILPLTPQMYITLGAAYILAGIVGIYAILVPSGLGVREAIIAAFATAYFTPEQAIVVALLARLYATVADGLIALLYLYMTHKRKKK